MPSTRISKESTGGFYYLTFTVRNLQKVEYVHNNPVRKGYVRRPEYWIWSSANQDSEVRVDPLPV
jgi:hypothetical protein